MYVAFLYELVVACDVVAHQHQIVHLNWGANFFHDFPPQCYGQGLTVFLAATGQQEESSLGVDIACNQEPAAAHDDGLGGYANVGHGGSILANRL